LLSLCVSSLSFFINFSEFVLCAAFYKKKSQKLALTWSGLGCLYWCLVLGGPPPRYREAAAVVVVPSGGDEEHKIIEIDRTSRDDKNYSDLFR